MSKMKLISVNAYKEQILNALYKTGCVELSETESFSDTFRASEKDGVSVFAERHDEILRAIEFYTDMIERSVKEEYFPKNYNELKDVFVSYDEFMNARKTEGEVLDIVARAKKMMDELASFKVERAKLQNINALLAPYLPIKEKFSEFKDTEFTKVFFGTVKKEFSEAINSEISEIETATAGFLTDGAESVLLAVCYRSDEETLSEKLLSLGFVACPFSEDETAQNIYDKNVNELANIEERENEIRRTICNNASDLKKLKILFDHYGFITEKENDDKNFSYTSSAFILEGFVPTEYVDKVRSELKTVTDAVFIEITDPSEDENVPTLLKNNFVVKQTEFITDMYSAPSYKEKDPNTVVFFFFMLFMGLIMADIGYGIIMFGLGLFLALKVKVDNGKRRLWYNIAFGGIFAIIFGVLFNSLFGVSVLPFTVLPNPNPSIGGKQGLMIVLLGCLALGVIQLAVGYFMKALNEFKAGNILAGIFEGLLWTVFFIGFVFAGFNFLLKYLGVEVAENITAFFNKATMPGLMTAGVAIVLIAIASGIKGKGFEKISKPFGTFYGLINIFSDVLSYARLFGLMLSGMIIAKTFNDIGSGMFSSGVIGYVLGGLIIVVGHIFNIAMGVLGAYIHDSRLQYIEFFGKFYTGEGNKFRPIGSDMKYVYVTKR